MLVAVQTVKQCQRIDPVHNPPAGGQQPQSIRYLIARGRGGKDLLCLRPQTRVPRLEFGIGSYALLHLSEVLRRGKETWMRAVEAGENVRRGWNRHGWFRGFRRSQVHRRDTEQDKAGQCGNKRRLMFHNLLLTTTAKPKGKLSNS